MRDNQIAFTSAREAIIIQGYMDIGVSERASHVASDVFMNRRLRLYEVMKLQALILSALIDS
jgi:hypothetical protein